MMGLHVDELAAILTCGESYYTIDKGEEGMILTHTDVETGMVNSATLALEDVTGFAVRSTKNFHTESFTF